MAPLAFARDFITMWEDGGSTDPAKTHSMDPDDNGNWSGGVKGSGNLIGSNHGVTAGALAVHLLLPVPSVTVRMMHALTLDAAAQMALSMYYVAPGLDKLPWDAVIASAFDFGWGAGPVQAVKLLQRMIGVADDGQPGRFTAAAYAEFVQDHGLEKVALMWADVRDNFYRLIVEKRPTNIKYFKGWQRRTAGYKPGTTWWRKFNG